MNNSTFESFPKIARLSRECVISEKIDGTNAQIFVTEDLPSAELACIPLLMGGDYGPWIAAGSRNRWITPDNDNYGFARWVQDNASELIKLGPGRHFGEWWGAGIQRTYSLQEKRFSLFNVHRWECRCNETLPFPICECEAGGLPECCSVVPVLYRGIFSTSVCDQTIDWLREYGSKAAPGFMRPEGIVIYHTASKTLFKKTVDGDESPKGKVQ